MGESGRVASAMRVMWSTGPRTAEGKARSSKNAMRHGLLSESLVVGEERQEEFDTLAEGLMRELGPVGELERVLAERVVSAVWRLRRALRVEWEMIWQDLNGLGSGPSDAGWTGRNAGTVGGVVAQRFQRDEAFTKFQRYEAHIERGLYRALHELERLQAKRRGEKVEAPRVVDVGVHMDGGMDGGE